ncbi:MAG: YidC/Oxa1 family membrane protein insertase [Granulosicoccus sp.]|nr:YidC/Oxa1 family membrane protein insertase [Granulosicoccus sp.]
MNLFFLKNTRQRARYLPAWLVAVLMFGIAGEAQAIPSPDLVINLSASIAQLLGLISVLFGGVALSVNKGAAAKKSNRLRKTSKKFFLGALALLVISASFNLLQYTRSIDAKNARLHTNLVRKSVENGQAVGDTNLQTLTFSEQKTHPLGVTTEKLAEWLDNDEPLNIIDVREDEEVEGGFINGARHIRYPDLLADPSLIDPSQNNLLLCYSGNRSSELCEKLSMAGQSCNFMVGGYEKWLTEERPVERTGGAAGGELRNLPDFANKDVLLDTPDVQKLVNEEKAEFIDVRYPGDFLLGHLPGAHNITMRALGSDELKVKLEELPKVPLIAACYDKRSCFYSQLVGLRLDRMGRDYRGRYTVPHEYYEAKGDREHVAQWQEANANVTLVSVVTEPLGRLLGWLSDVSGHYVLGILLLVLLARLPLLPLMMKAERDSVVQKSLLPDIEQLKLNYADHPRALGKATMRLYRDHKIKPVFNVVSSFLQLGFLLLFFKVVDSTAANWTQQFAWLELPSVKDPFYVLPALVTGLFMLVLLMQLKLNSRKKKIALAIGGLAFFALVATMSAAVNIYFTISMAVLVLQNLFIAYVGKKRNWAREPEPEVVPPADDGMVALRYAHLVPSTGKKAARLGELIAAGYNVPDGFVFTSAITDRVIGDNQSAAAQSAAALDDSDAVDDDVLDETSAEQLTPTPFLNDEERKRLSQMWLKLKAEKVAVRSSGLTEDGADTSFAGVYDSILNVRKGDLVAAVRKVHRSLASEVADTYNQNVNHEQIEKDQPSRLGGVVVQKMVDAEFAGVMFTEHPANAGAILVEVVAGLGEDLVSGNVTPDSYSYGKVTRTPLDEQTCEIDLEPLIKLGQELELMFEHPQDIEWAYAGGQFYLLQTRDITRSVCDLKNSQGYAESERRRLLELTQTAAHEEVVLAQNELSELLPRPTPLSATFMSRLWSAGGSTDIACQQLGIPYDVNYQSDPFVTTVFGQTYINKLEEKIRLGTGPGALASFQLARDADQIEQRFRQEILPDLKIASVMDNALDYSRLTLSQMVDTLNKRLDQFITETYVEAEIINIATDYYWKTAKAKLDSDGLQASDYLNYVPRTIVSDAMSMISEGDENSNRVRQFLNVFGHRAPLDYELSLPRYAEDPQLVLNLMQNSGHEAHAEDFPTLPTKRLLKISVDRVHRFQALKEEAKHYCMLELYQIRRMLLAIDEVCMLDGNIFLLRLDEVSQLNDKRYRKHAQHLIKQRQEEAETWKSISPPTTLSIRDLECMDVTTGRVARNEDDQALVGTRVAGEGSVSGTARVVRSIEEIELFREDEILVARMTDPQWYPLFPKARGIVTEVGGWLSHAAIVAREYNLPATVGVANACNAIESGDIIELHADGRINLITDRRSPESPLRTKVERPAVAENNEDPVAIQSSLRARVIDLQQILNRTLQGSEAKAANSSVRNRADKKQLRDAVRQAEPANPFKKAQ